MVVSLCATAADRGFMANGGVHDHIVDLHKIERLRRSMDRHRPASAATCDLDICHRFGYFLSRISLV
jgi:hypothetical protein